MELKLGKLDYKHDPRTLRLNEVLQDKLPVIPDTFDVDDICGLGKIDNPMFANDRYGNCVLAGRAHMTRRLEAIEQKRVVEIDTADVLTEYWKEQGWKGMWCKKPDRGLVMLDSLNAWRKGWDTVSGNYPIHAFALVNWRDFEMVKATMYLLGGAYTGVLLPLSAKEQFENGMIWTVTDKDYAPGSWGGHCMYLKGIVGFGGEYLYVFVTWGKEQLATRTFMETYCDELWGIVDKPNGKGSIIDIKRLEAYLETVKANK